LVIVVCSAADRMSRPCLAVAALVLLGGCSSTFFAAPPGTPTAEQEPADYPGVVAKDLEGVKGHDGNTPFEISAARRTRLAQPGDWVVCARRTVEERPTYFAVFLRDGKVIDRRLAVQVDECAQEQFQPLPADKKPSRK